MFFSISRQRAHEERTPERRNPWLLCGFQKVEEWRGICKKDRIPVLLICTAYMPAYGMQLGPSPPPAEVERVCCIPSFSILLLFLNVVII